MLLIHHLLEHSSGVHAWKVVVFKCRHKRHCTCSDDKMFSVDICHLLCHYVLDSYAFAFEQVPNNIIQQYAFVVVASQSLRDVETTHATEFLLLLEKEELVCLHVKLTADTSVVVNHDIADAKFIKLFAASETCRTGTDDGDLCLVDLHLAWLQFFSLWKHVSLVVDRLHFLHSVDQSDADTADLAVDKHLAGAALSDAAVKASVATVEAMAMNRKTSLMQSGSDGVAFLANHFLSVINKLY